MRVLKPCPCCGGDAVLRQKEPYRILFFIACTECDQKSSAECTIADAEKDWDNKQR